MKSFSPHLWIVVSVGAVLVLAVFVWSSVRDSMPALVMPESGTYESVSPPVSEQIFKSETEAVASGENRTGLPLMLPAGFRISVFAKNLSGARAMLLDTRGNMWVSRSAADTVTRLEIQNGAVESQKDILTDLNHPHGLAIDPDNPDVLYIGEEDQITKVLIDGEGARQKIADLPSGGGHSTRTLLFGPDKRLLVSIGSSCNVCVERDARRAAIYSLNTDGSDFKPFATGLRNSVFMALHPTTQELWATDMGRDRLGDDIPPEDINIVREGKQYGWPYCYGMRVHDADFDSKGEKSAFCESTEPPRIEIPAHSAPLGLAFLKHTRFPTEYRHNLLVAYHGSWNRSVPTGYKVVRHVFDAEGKYLGVEDFIVGWLAGGNIYGRPVDILESADGKIFISDDKAGVIYLVEYIGA